MSSASLNPGWQRRFWGRHGVRRDGTVLVVRGDRADVAGGAAAAEIVKPVEDENLAEEDAGRQE